MSFIWDIEHINKIFILLLNLIILINSELMKNKIITINNILIEYFGIPKRNKKNPDPVDMLIGTILSQNTNDKNSYRAYQNLKAKYKNWGEVAELPLIKINKAIKVAAATTGVVATGFAAAT